MSEHSSQFAPGDAVVYRPHPGAQAEDGEVVRTNDSYVFVLFVGDRAAKAVAPSLLKRSAALNGTGEEAT